MYGLVDRYIGITLTKSVFIVLTVLTSLHGIVKFLEEMPDTGKGTYTAGIAAVYVFSILPKAMNEFFPASCLIGGLLGLGQLSASNELTIIRAAGISKLGVYVSTIKTALLLTAIMFILGEFVAPKMEQFGNDIRVEHISKGKIKRSEEGLWIKDKNQFVYITSYRPDTILKGVRIFILDQKYQLSQLISAASAKMENGYWHLKSVDVEQFSLQSVNQIHLDSMSWKTSIDQEKLNIVNVEPDEMTLPDLMQYRAFLKESTQNSKTHDLDFYRRLVKPFVIAVMILLALSFVFAQPRSGSLGARLVLGVVVGFGFYIVNRLFGPLSTVYEIPPVLASIIPVSIFLVIGYWMLRRSA